MAWSRSLPFSPSLACGQRRRKLLVFKAGVLDNLLGAEIESRAALVLKSDALYAPDFKFALALQRHVCPSHGTDIGRQAAQIGLVLGRVMRRDKRE